MSTDNVTLLLLAVTAAIVAWQSFETRRAATATAAALALQQTAHRAYVTMSHKPPGLKVEAFVGTGGPDNLPMQRIQVAIRVDNTGGSLGTVTRVVLHPCFSADALPDVPVYEEASAVDSWALIGQGETLNFPFTFTVLDSEWNNLFFDRSTSLYLLGYVDYVTDNGSHRRDGYCRRYDASHLSQHALYLRGDEGEVVVEAPDIGVNNLMLVPNRAYSYDRERRHGEGTDWY